MGEILRIARNELRRLERTQASDHWEAQRDTLALLLAEGVGEDHAISNQEIRNRIGERGRSAQWFQYNVLIPLRERGAFLAWGPRGYYLPETEADFEAAVGSYVRRIKKEKAHMAALKAAWDGDLDRIGRLFPDE